MIVETSQTIEYQSEIGKLFNQVYTPEKIASVVWRDVKSAKPTKRALHFENGTLLSAVGIHFRQANLNGQKCFIGGVGGVMTHPNHRRKGYARILIDEALKTMTEDGAKFSLLFCEEHNIDVYRSLSWTRFQGAILAEKGNTSIPYSIMTPMVISLCEQAPELGTIDLCGLPW